MFTLKWMHLWDVNRCSKPPLLVDAACGAASGQVMWRAVQTGVTLWSQHQRPPVPGWGRHGRAGKGTGKTPGPPFPGRDALDGVSQSGNVPHTHSTNSP